MLRRQRAKGDVRSYESVQAKNDRKDAQEALRRVGREVTAGSRAIMRGGDGNYRR